MVLRKIPFAFSILILLAGLVLVMAATLMTFGVQTSLKIREASTNQLVSEFQRALKREFLIKFDNAAAVQYEMVHSPATQAYQQGDDSDLITILRSLSTAYRLLPDSISAYVGMEDGRFIMLQDLESVKKYHKYKSETDVPEDAIYRLRHIHYKNDTKVEDIGFLDKDFEILQQNRNYTPDYNPTKRPWYHGALDAQNTFIGKPYQFSGTDYTGLTISRPLLDQKGVVGLDVAIELMDYTLASHKLSPSSVSFIFMEDGTLISHPNRHNLSELDQQLIDISLKSLDLSTDKTTFKSDLGEAGEFQFFLAPKFTNEYSQHHLAVIAPISELNQKTDALRWQSFMIFIVTFLLGFLLIIYATNKISISIKLLSKKSQKIGRFDLDESFLIDTRIRELSTLSETLEQMRAGIQEFGKYVPRQLVKQIIQDDQQIDLSGENRDITVLFTDIENFTSISEGMAPDALLSQTSAYFQVFAPIIHTQYGIIDKYIGDSVMAFWNAPELTEDHAYHACFAALKVNEALDHFNTQMIEEGKPAFVTRIGINTGPSIVGNVGSEDRKNFTIFGSTVNIASRLESMNKRFGSRLLISEAIYHQVKDRLLCRPLEKVVPKGAHESLIVYELMGFNSDDKLKEICALDHKCFEHFYAGKTEDALDVLKEILKLSPEDKVAQNLLERYQDYLDNGYPADYLKGIMLDQK